MKKLILLLFVASLSSCGDSMEQLSGYPGYIVLQKEKAGTNVWTTANNAIMFHIAMPNSKEVETVKSYELFNQMYDVGDTIK